MLGQILRGWSSPKALPEHLKVPWTVRDAVVVFLGPWIVLPVVVVLLARVMAPFVPWADMLIQGLRHDTPEASFVLAIVDVLGALGLLALYLRRYRAKWTAVGWRKFDAVQTAGYLMAIFIVFVVSIRVVLTLVSVLDPTFDAQQPQTNELLDAAGTHRALALIALVILPPFVEESVFRGFVFPALAKRMGLIWGAIGSSVLFGFAHLQANVAVYTFILGMLLCFLYTRVKSIVPGIALHMLNNYLAFLALTHGK